MDRSGISMYELSRIAPNFDFDTNALEGSLDELVKAIEENELNLQLIAYINTKEELSHFIVIKRLNRKYFFVFDPEKGHYKIEINDFGEIWNNCILNIYPNRDFEKKNYKKEMYLKYLSLLSKVKKEILFNLYYLL